MPEQSWLDKAKGYIPLLSFVSIIGIGITYFQSEGKFKQFVEDRIFTEPEQLLKVNKHIDEGPTASQEREAQIMDSLDKLSKIKSRELRDSVFILIRKDQQYQDSIMLLNADQMFQIKEEIKKIQLH